MRPTYPRLFRVQANLLRRQFLQDGGLPFTDILTADVLSQALAAVGGWLDRIFSPLVTLWVFLGQVLSPDHSCRAAVARLIAPGSPAGRGRARPGPGRTAGPASGCRKGSSPPWRARSAGPWTPGPSAAGCGRGGGVYLFDGTTVAMPDTTENQATYPQVYNQGPGLGFPIARIGAVISLACGAVVNLGLCGSAPCFSGCSAGHGRRV